MYERKRVILFLVGVYFLTLGEKNVWMPFVLSTHSGETRVGVLGFAHGAAYTGAPSRVAADFGVQSALPPRGRAVARDVPPLRICILLTQYGTFAGADLNTMERVVEKKPLTATPVRAIDRPKSRTPVSDRALKRESQNTDSLCRWLAHERRLLERRLERQLGETVAAWTEEAHTDVQRQERFSCWFYESG